MEQRNAGADERLSSRAASLDGAALSDYLCSAPRPDSRHASARYKGRGISVDVVQDVVREGTCIVVVVAPPNGTGRPQTIEYITDYTRFDEGLSAGFGIARDVVEGIAPRVPA